MTRSFLQHLLMILLFALLEVSSQRWVESHGGLHLHFSECQPWCGASHGLAGLFFVFGEMPIHIF